MQHVSSSFTTSDGLAIHTEAWLPEGDARAALVVVHGAAEHIGRYAHVAPTLTSAGYAVYGYDMRGHGKSDGKRGYFRTFEDPISDLEQYLKLVRSAHAGRKLFVLAHSMGAVVALAYILRVEAADVDGVITMGAPLTIDDGVPNLLISAARTINHLAPDVPIVSLDVTGMSRDPAVLATWTTDPHVNLTLIRVRTTLGILGTVRYIRAHLADIHLPMLILHGGGDRIVDASGSRVLYNGVAAEDKTLKVYPELYHEIVNEPERDMILRDIRTWVDERT